jgi:glucose-6-phosphate isomerase
MAISLDTSHMFEDVIGESGITQSEFNELIVNMGPVHDQIQRDKHEGGLGYTKLPYQTTALQEILQMAEVVRHQCKYLIVVGIGGSDLGTRAVHRALNHQFYNQVVAERDNRPKIYFVGDTTDPVDLQEVLDVVDLKESIVVMVSKSGNTIEQMSTFLYLRQRILEVVGEERLKERIITVTDAAKGTLRDLTNREGYRSLAIPEDVGGRFSVLSAVGLFPLAVVGVDIRKLLEGAAAMDKHNSETPLENNLPAIYTLTMFLAYTTRHQPIRVLMPYVYSLREFGFWYRQLWAESLGKAQTIDGDLVQIGPTPIASLGPTDQHSQMQLYMEGPVNKVITFVTVKESPLPLTVPAAYPDMEGIAYLAGKNFQDILLAEQESTAYALAQAGRPNCHLQLDRLDAYSLGELLYFFELAVTYGGRFHRINPFDQPAVEIGKRFMYGALGREGYSEYKIVPPATQRIWRVE